MEWARNFGWSESKLLRFQRPIAFIRCRLAPVSFDIDVAMEMLARISKNLQESLRISKDVNVVEGRKSSSEYPQRFFRGTWRESGENLERIWRESGENLERI